MSTSISADLGNLPVSLLLIPNIPINSLKLLQSGHWKQWKLKTETEKLRPKKLKLVKTSY